MIRNPVVASAWRVLYWQLMHPLVARFRRLMGKVRSFANVRKVNACRNGINLELGSGRRSELSDWMFSDWAGGGDFSFDLTKAIPLGDGTVKRIYMSHVLEHFSYPDPMLGLLKECYRILMPGGTIRIAVPDARIFLNAYANPQGFARSKYCSWEVGLDYDSPMNFVNFIAYLGGEHKHLFDDYELRRVICNAGFSSAESTVFDSSIDLARRREESVYAIGIK